MNDLISRQTAVDGVKTLHEVAWKNWHDPTLSVNVVIDMIKDLPSAQPELCDDAVSRKDAIRWVKTECNPYGKPTLDFESGKKVIEHLKRMSPVTPKRKRGKWEFIGDNMVKCTSCGVVYTTRQLNALRTYTTDSYFPKFCPNCGTMVG